MKKYVLLPFHKFQKFEQKMTKNSDESENADEERNQEKSLAESQPVEDINVAEKTLIDPVQEGGQKPLPPPGIPLNAHKTTLKSKKTKSDWKNQWKALQ